MQRNLDNKNILVFAHYTVQDPPTANTIKSLLKLGYSVRAIQQSDIKNYDLESYQNFKLITIYDFRFFKLLKGGHNLFKWIYFKIFILIYIKIFNPNFIIGWMLHPLDILKPTFEKKYQLISVITDIPSLEYAGKLDKNIISNAWQKIKFADVMWASDIYKAELAQKYGNLDTLPLVCHNCPASDYIKKDLWPRDNWLRQQLANQVAEINETTCILIRAGAIGPYGGIEETLEAMLSLPINVLFFMMGRPNDEYKNKIFSLINELNLNKRVFLWIQPDDYTWKKALLGADIGHLIHLRPESGSIAANYYLNSSLSNNRLFQYMAAGLPIISYNDPRMNLIYNEVDCFKVVDVNNLVESLIKNINGLYENEQDRIRLGKNGREAHLKKYNWEYQFEPVLEKIVTKK
jgi:glycosyltransferase involved in cell wall biosynthesis